jgi:hypothetical protein
MTKPLLRAILPKNYLKIWTLLMEAHHKNLCVPITLAVANPIMVNPVGVPYWMQLEHILEIRC